MTCNIKLDNTYFEIKYLSRLDSKKKSSYFFVGEQSKSIENILIKLKKNEKIDKKEIDTLKEIFGEKNIKKWSKKSDIHFIYDLIHLDDTVKDIKNKIFYYLNLLPINIQLWTKLNSDKYQFLGNYFDIPDLIPSIYNKLKVDKEFNPNDYILINNNHILISDIIEDDVLYLCNSEDDYNFLKNKKVKVTEKLMNGYFKKYYPLINLDYDKQELQKDKKLLQNYIEKQKYIYSLFQNTNSLHFFSDCNITGANILVNYQNKNIDNIIDVYQIFDLILQKLNIDIPFIKYNDTEFNHPISIVYKQIIDYIDQKRLKNWLGIRKNNFILSNFNKGLNFKKLVDNKYLYSNIYIPLNNEYKNTYYELKCSFSENDNIQFHQLIDMIHNLNDFISEINSYTNRFHIQGATVNIENDRVIFGDNTKLGYLNVVIDYNLNKDINFKNLYELASHFTEFLEIIPQIGEPNNFQCKYKKISNYINLDKVFKFITKQKKDGVEENLIIRELQMRYDIDIIFSKDLMNQWAKYGFMQNFNSIGVNCTIYSKKIKIDGIMNIEQLSQIYRFFYMFMNIYDKYSTYKSNSYFKKYILEIDDLDIDFSFHKSMDIGMNINMNMNLNMNTYNITNYFVNQQLQNEDIDNKELLDEKYQFTENEEIEATIRLECGPDSVVVEEVDTCEDLCADKSYFLRRLQRYDKVLFRYTISENKKAEEQSQYSRKCQKNDDKLPIPLNYDPALNPKVDPKSFTYSLNYGIDNKKYWYICPEVWCPYCEIPILYSRLTHIREKKDGKSVVCRVARCPNSENSPFGEHECFVKKEKNKNTIYPGFLEESAHPDGYCLPCCFKKPHNTTKSKFYERYSKCLGLDVQIEKKGKESLYILKKSIIDIGRYGVLPFYLSKLLGTKCESGPFENKSCFLRAGINNNNKTSFLNAINYYVKALNINQLKNQLIDKLNPTLFKSLNSGNLEFKFYNKYSNSNSLSNFKQYISENNYLNYEYLWDLFQRPNVLFEYGINIIIFENNSLLCPYQHNIHYFYNPSLNTIILNKNGAYFEPVVFVINNENKLFIEKEFNSQLPQIDNLFNILKEGCKERYTINWNEYLLSKNKNAFVSDKKDLSLNQLIDLEVFEIKNQIVDAINKVVFIQLENNIVIPCSPSELNIHLPFNNIFNIELNNYKTTNKLLKQYSHTYKLPLKPVFKILDEKNNLIAIVIETGRIVPVNMEKGIISSLPKYQYNYFKDADLYLQDGTLYEDERTKNVTKLNIEQESYERIRFELSKYLLEHTKLKKDVKNILEGNLPMKQKREELSSILQSIFDDLILFEDIDENEFKINNIRRSCFNKKENIKDDFCVKNNKKFKLRVSKHNLIYQKDNSEYYLFRLVEELLFNKTKLKEIMDDEIKDAIDKTKIQENYNYVIIDENNVDKVTSIIQDLYMKSNIYINPDNLLTYQEFKNVDFDKSKFKTIYTTKKNENIELNNYWSKILGHNFHIQSNTNLFLNNDGEMESVKKYVKSNKINVIVLGEDSNFELIGPEYFDCNEYIMVYLSRENVVYSGDKYIFGLDDLPEKIKLMVANVEKNLNIQNRNVETSIKMEINKNDN